MPKKIGLRMILYLYLAVFLTRIGFGSITILFPLYLPTGAFQVGLILALYPIAEACSAMPIGRLADRLSRKRLHLAGMGSITVLTAAIGFTRNLLDVSVLHAIMGISAALAAVTSLTLLGDATKQTNRGKKMGGFDLANLGGYGLGFGLGSVLVSEFSNSHYGLSEAFWVTSGIFFVTSLLATKFLVEPVRSFELKQPGLRRRHIGEKIRPVLPVWLGQTIVLGMYFLLPKAFEETSFTVTREMLIFLGVIGGLFAMGAIVFGHISDKVGRTRIMIVGAVGELGFLSLFGWSFPNFLIYPIPLILAPLFFLASAIAPAILSYVSDISGKARRGSANGIYSVVLSAGMAVGNILGGFFAEYGVQWIFFAGAGIMAPAILVTSSLMRRG
jgi:MFS transporter, DHA1 family, multidrug resistance protein